MCLDKRISFSVNPQPNLAFLTVSTLNRDTCNTQLFGRVTERMLCARGNQNNQGVCLPNRGGGLYCNNLLTGVLSFGFGCGTSNMPGVYVQVKSEFHEFNVLENVVARFKSELFF